MKKFFTVFLAFFTMFLFSFAVSASAFLTGDMNGDGEITAADARTVLRIAAELEKAEPEQRTAADVDGDGAVTAADARIVLRVAAKLDVFPERPAETETQEDRQPETQAPSQEESLELPREVQIFLDGTYTFDGTIDIDGEIPLRMTTDGNALRLDCELLGIKIRMLFCSDTNQIYVLNEEDNTYTFLSDTMLAIIGAENDFPFDDMMIDNGEETDTILVCERVENGQTYTVYTLVYETESVEFFVLNGKLVRIVYHSEAAGDFACEILSVTDEIDEALLTTETMTLVSLSSFLSGLVDDAADGYDPNNEWDREYWYDEYWQEPVDWDSLEAAAVPLEELPSEILFLQGDMLTLSGVVSVNLDWLYPAAEDNLFLWEDSFAACEFRYVHSPEATRASSGYDLEYSLLKITETTLFGREKETAYVIREPLGTYTSFDSLFQWMTGFEEDSFMFGVDTLLTAGSTEGEITKKTAAGENGEDYMLIVITDENGSESRFTFIDGVLDRIDMYEESGKAILRAKIETIADSVEEAELTVDGLKKQTAHRFVRDMWYP